MDYSAQYLRFTAVLVLSALFVKAGDIRVYGIVGSTVHLKCDIPVSDDPDVEWVDKVYGSDTNPEKIFNSQGNSHLAVRDKHQNKDDYSVNDEFTLTISNLNMDQDVGQYTCRSRVGDKVHKIHYYLTIGVLPNCSGINNLRSGEDTELTCEMAFSGQQPVLQWFEEDDLLQSVDAYDIRMAKKIVRVHATHRQDGVKFRCQMTLDSSVHECNITLNVTYAVHEPKFHPVKDSLEAGDELRCSAKGNPTPTVTLVPDLPNVVSGSGWAAIIIEQSWQGQHMEFKCSASNLIDGIEHSKSQNHSFAVTVHKKHHNRHSTATVSLPEDVELEQHAPADQHSVHSETDTSKTAHESKHEQKQKPDVKPVRSDNSAGNLVTFTLTVSLLSLSAALLI